MGKRNIFELIKNILEFYFATAKTQLLNPPIKEMTNVEKSAYLTNLVTNLKKKTENIDKIIEFINTIEDTDRIIFVHRIQYYMLKKKILDSDGCSEVFKKLYLNCIPKQQKIMDLILNLITYSNFAEEILETVIDDIEKEEIEFILTAENNHYNSIKEMQLLLSKGFDLDYVYENQEIEKNLLYGYIDNLSPEKAITFLEKRIAKENAENSEKDYSQEIEYLYSKNISKIDKQYLKICASKGKIGYLDVLNKEELKEFLNKYGKKVIELEKKYERKIIDELLDNCIEFSDDSILDIDELKKFALSLQNDVKNRVIEWADELIKKNAITKDRNIKLEKYKAFSEDEKRNFLINNDNKEELDDIFTGLFYYEVFRETLTTISKEEIVYITKNHPGAFIGLLENPNVSLEDVYELLHNKEISLSNYQLLDKNTFIGKVHNEDKDIKKSYFKISMEDAVELYNFDEEFAYSRFLMHYSHMIEKEKIDYEYLKTFAGVLERYYKSEEYKHGGTEYKIINGLTEENVRRFIKEYPDKIQYIDFNKMENEVFINLYDDLKDNRFYNTALIKKWNIVELIGEEKVLYSLTKYLESLSKDECSNLEGYFLYQINGNNKFIVEKALTSGNISKEQLFLLVENNIELAKFLGNQIALQNSKEFETDIYKLLEKIDESGELLSLYKSLDENHMKDLIENGATKYLDDSPEYEIIKRKSEFLINLPLIYYNKKDIIELKKKNPNLMYVFNFKMLKVFDTKNLEFYSKYQQMQEIKDNIFYVDGLKEKIQYIEERLDYPQEQVFKLLKFCSKFESKEQAEKFWGEFSIEETLAIINEKDYLLNQTNQINIHLFEDIRKFTKERIDYAINNPNSTREEILNAYAQRFFWYSYSSLRDLVNGYGSDIDVLLGKYPDDRTLSSQEEIEKNYLLHLKYLKELLKEEDCQALKEEFIAKNNDPMFSNINYIGNIALKEKVRELYTKEKRENLYSPIESDREKDVLYRGNKVRVYKPKGDFNILITVVGAYVSNSRIDDTPYETWNQKEKNTSQDICCSLIGNDNLSMAKSNDGIKFGFIKFVNNDIRSEAPRDLISNSSRIDIKTYRKEKFRTTQNMKDHIRNGHSEHLLERFIVESNGEIRKRQPDYVIAINIIRKKDLKAAQEFNVPIVLLNTREIAERESKKLQELKNDLLNEEKIFSADSLRRFIISYHNNYAGMYNFDKKSVRKYFNSKKMELSMQEIVDRIIRIEDTNYKRKLLQEFIQAIDEEKDKYVDVLREYIPFNFDKVRGRLEKELKMVNSKTDKSSNKRGFNYDLTKREAKKEETTEKKQINLDDTSGGR